MNESDDPRLRGRRRFLASAATVAAVAATAPVAATAHARASSASSETGSDSEPFFGTHQAGVATTPQANVYFAAFDLIAEKRDDVIALLRAWTAASARLTQGQTADLLTNDPATPELDSYETTGLATDRLTLTFGFGPGMFTKDGKDRYDLAKHRPDALADLPRFNGDQLVPERTGGDLCIQACADNPQVAFHAVRQLTRIAYGAANIRWAQSGFMAAQKDQSTPRNLMGFKDGSMNVPIRAEAAMNQYIWAGDEGGWMQHGTYMVARPIRIALEHWDRMKLSFQQQVMGREKHSGAPLGQRHENDSLALDANDANGNPIIPENAHVRLGAPENNDGAQILRRSYSYDNGLSYIAERWPPWHQGMEFDAGLLFISYQRDPRTGFVKIFDKMSKFDMMNQFVTHVGGGVFACPPGAKEGGFIGQPLFDLT
ncbi:iron uptake transporter deferrochelatase/peroxidase subunit [Rhodanobacter sp. MP1X3]|uniref:iron uptake transporter deferrochelatase/peroxidase subunit n=1 Tax=Rhodanobacter sp. MP1X3 TaxID=2723086 RepID=UPI00161735E0|nr:iron uptake transporter deferrochelatase/peroxidase subunit [Rhodanobacter sp. MP1X3]MBB6243589.1 deferrochelatase/peroxidase EfeB [Rhodanobacter sp. MP1X3]